MAPVARVSALAALPWLWSTRLLSWCPAVPGPLCQWVIVARVRTGVVCCPGLRALLRFAALPGAGGGGTAVCGLWWNRRVRCCSGDVLLSFPLCYGFPVKHLRTGIARCSTHCFRKAAVPDFAPHPQNGAPFRLQMGLLTNHLPGTSVLLGSLVNGSCILNLEKCSCKGMGEVKDNEKLSIQVLCKVLLF